MKAETPSLGTRIRVVGFVGLWLLEWVANGLQLALFVVRRGTVRRHMRELIVGVASPVDNAGRRSSGDGSRASDATGSRDTGSPATSVVDDPQDLQDRAP